MSPLIKFGFQLSAILGEASRCCVEL